MLRPFIAILITLPLAVQAAHPRSAAVKAEFQRLNPCPANGARRGACPGYVKDHIVPLDCNGLDIAQNLQWQTVADAKAKDKWERKQCGK